MDFRGLNKMLENLLKWLTGSMLKQDISGECSYWLCLDMARHFNSEYHYITSRSSLIAPIVINQIREDNREELSIILPATILINYREKRDSSQLILTDILCQCHHQLVLYSHYTNWRLWYFCN